MLEDGTRGVIAAEDEVEPGVWWVQVGGEEEDHVAVPLDELVDAVAAAEAVGAPGGGETAAGEGEVGERTGQTVWGYFPEGRYSQRGLLGGWCRGRVGELVPAPPERQAPHYKVRWFDEPEDELLLVEQVEAMAAEEARGRKWVMDEGTRQLVKEAKKMKGKALAAALRELGVPVSCTKQQCEAAGKKPADLLRQRLATAYALRSAGAAAVVANSELLQDLGLQRFAMQSAGLAAPRARPVGTVSGVDPSVRWALEQRGVGVGGRRARGPGERAWEPPSPAQLEAERQLSCWPRWGGCGLCWVF